MSQKVVPLSGGSRPVANKAAGGSSSTAPIVNIQEYSIRVPKNLKKVHHVMRFNATLNVDFAKWQNVKMERENNMREFRGMDEENPKFGAGSEFNKDFREEVRRKKLGITARKYKADAQPWILKVGRPDDAGSKGGKKNRTEDAGIKGGKKFRGIREGGVGDNAAFYVFTHAPDGAIEAYPLNEWYNFQPVQRYKTLSAEEAEVEFGRRNQVMNYFSLMFRKRFKGDEDEKEDPEEKLKAIKKAKELKISDMDEWIDSDDDSDSSDDDAESKAKRNKDNGDTDDDKKKKKNKKGQPEKKKKRDVDDEAFEESDDGDEEGRERDYISDSSEPDSDPEAKANKEMKSVAEEDALRKLLTSDEDSDEEKRSGDESNKEEDKNGNNNKKEAKEKENKDNKSNSSNKKKKPIKKAKDEKKESLSDFSSDSSDSEAESKAPPAATFTKNKVKLAGSSANNSRSGSPSLSNVDASASSALKRKLPSDLTVSSNSNGPSSLGGSENSNSPTVTPAKKTKYDTPGLPASFAGVISSRDDYGITEDAVRRYLSRKPMTTTELLKKFQSKKTGVSSEKLVETMTQILKRINPHKQTIQGKMYLSIKNK